jgi:hypothetical protein
LPISAVDAINPAIEHTRQQLFGRFRIGQWTKLAFVGLLAGELGGNGCSRSNFQIPHPAAGTLHGDFPSFGGSFNPGSLGIDPALLTAFITATVIAAVAVFIIFFYINSVMRFALFDSIVTRECRIGWSWNRNLTSGWRYFIWRVFYALLVLAGIAALVGLPVGFAFSKGWFRAPGEHVLPLILGGAFFFTLVAALAVTTAVVFVLTKDFVVPLMALENISASEGWRRLWAIMEPELGAYLAYILMKIVLAIVTSILIFIAALIVGVFFVVPTVALGVLAFLTGKNAGLTWNPHTIALAATVGLILLLVFLYLVSLVAVPAIVFFPAYSMYFFAGRYPRLAVALNSASLSG